MDQAIQYWQEGKKLEQEKNYNEAITKYKLGCESAIKWLKFDQLEARRAELQKKIVQFLDHAEQLKKIANQPVKQPQQQNGGSGEKEEKNELQEAIKQCIVIEKPTVSFKDVAGLEKIKQMLLEAVILPKKMPQLFNKDRQPWTTILLYGVPGTGKTFIAQAMCNECNSTFFSVSSSDLVSKWQGESERLIRTLFELARKEESAIIFIDEIDSLCSARGAEGENEASRRIKTEFLVQMQGVGKDNKNILIIGATNYPENIDSAIRRRFQKRVEIPLPEPIARLQIIKNGVKNTENDITEQQFQQIANQTEGYSASDLKNMMKDAVMQPIRELSANRWWKEVNNKIYIAQQNEPGSYESPLMELDGSKLEVPNVSFAHLQRAMNNTKKSVSKQDIQRIDKFTDEFGQEG